MRLLPNCRDVTALVLRAQDQSLPWTSRLAVALHMRICDPCPRFRRQVQLMSAACQQWRRYSETE